MDVFIALERLAAFPRSGRVVPELGKDTIREVLLGSYRIVYRVKEECAEIITIYHGARLFDKTALK